MDVLISNWKDVKSVPQSFILPPNIRPGKNTVPICTEVPIIDLQKSCNGNRAEIIQQILNASTEFGLFQVINHGVSTTLMDDAMNVSKAFFGMPSEYKASFYSNDSTCNCRLYTSTLNYDKEEFHFWRDNLTHRSHPSLADHILFWPDKPTNYRKTISSYSTEVRKLLLNILDMISEGLGLDLGYFEGGLSQNQLMSINHHIPCPDPSLTLGMPEHGDPNLISMLHEGDVSGLQILKDGQWLAVNPLLNALVVIPGLQLRVISNEKFKTVIHRAVTNSEATRTTISVFVIPSIDFIIEPARSLISGNNNPIYRAYTYKEFFNTYIQNKCDVEAAMKCFRAFNDK